MDVFCVQIGNYPHIMMVYMVCFRIIIIDRCSVFEPLIILGNKSFVRGICANGYAWDIVCPFVEVGLQSKNEWIANESCNLIDANGSREVSKQQNDRQPSDSGTGQKLYSSVEKVKCAWTPFNRGIICVCNVSESMETRFFTEFHQECCLFEISANFLQFFDQITIW